MAIVQVGYFSGVGPLFVDDSTVAGKYIILQGENYNGNFVLRVKSSGYATNLNTFPYAASLCVFGPYTDNQTVMAVPAHKAPANTTTGGYQNIVSGWVDVPASSGGTGLVNQTDKPATTSTGTTTSTTTSTSTGTSDVSTGGSGTVDNTAGLKAATIGEQITAFFKDYWYVVVLLAVLLLWGPVISPALGLSKKRKRSYR